MKATKKLLILMVLLVSILSVSAVSATDIDGTTNVTEGDNTTVEPPIDVPEIDENGTVSEDNETIDTPETPETGDNETETGDNETVETPETGDNETETGDNETVETGETQLITEDIEMFYKNGTKYEVTVIGADGNPVVNSTVQITINGVAYNRTTDENGKASLSLNLGPGVYTVTATFNGTSINSTVEIINTLSADNIIKYYKNGTQYYITVVDGQGNPLANTTVKLNINGVIYERVTNENGTAQLNINLNPGEYIITAEGPNGATISNNITVLSTISSNNVIKYYRNGTQYYVTVLDEQGNPLVNATVKLNINGVIYERVTNENGTAQLNINLNPGEYIITAEAPNGEMISNNVTVLSKIVVEDMSKDFKENASYSVTILDDQGNPIPNATVSLNINGVFYNRTTNENGTAYLAINLNPGTYTITAEYGDSKASSEVTVKKMPASIKIINSELKTNEKLMVNVTSNGEPVADRNIYFIYDNVAYYTKSDVNGIASIGIGLPKGDYSFMIGIIDDAFYSDVLVMTTIHIQ